MPGFYGSLNPSGLHLSGRPALSAFACTQIVAQAKRNAKRYPSFKAYYEKTYARPLTDARFPRSENMIRIVAYPEKPIYVSTFKRSPVQAARSMPATTEINTASKADLKRMLDEAEATKHRARVVGTGKVAPHHAYDTFACTMLRGQACNKCRTHTTTRKAALAALHA